MPGYTSQQPTDLFQKQFLAYILLLAYEKTVLFKLYSIVQPFLPRAFLCGEDVVIMIEAVGPSYASTSPDPLKRECQVYPNFCAPSTQCFCLEQQLKQCINWCLLSVSAWFSRCWSFYLLSIGWQFEAWYTFSFIHCINREGFIILVTSTILVILDSDDRRKFRGGSVTDLARTFLFICKCYHS